VKTGPWRAGGTVSVSVTALTAPGPLLVTVRVYESGAPGTAVARPSVMARDRSAAGGAGAAVQGTPLIAPEQKHTPGMKYAVTLKVPLAEVGEVKAPLVEKSKQVVATDREKLLPSMARGGLLKVTEPVHPGRANPNDRGRICVPELITVKV
jgi:hypothetical protein